MNDPLSARLRFHGRYAAETQDEMASRKCREREEAAGVIDNLLEDRKSYVAWTAEIKTSIDWMKAEIGRLREQLLDQRCPSDVRGTIRECIAAKTCGCTNGLILGNVEQSEGGKT